MPLTNEGTADLHGAGGFGPEDFLPGLDGAAPLVDGYLDLSAPTIDIDGDGVLDTLSFHLDGRVVVVTDTNLDGLGDRVTWVDSEGAYECWQFVERAEAQLEGTQLEGAHGDGGGPGPGGVGWQRVDHGSVTTSQGETGR